ncbi:metal dependent phosphohydrolase [Malonomonas rubra DSM 5091]|uniref:Metal dependent phosphohydrolase n=1 Tax=Malonomonas rubra DSM 5091 TaxID=1122189 RepID=A0A1M6DYU1_MALRU|nr:HDIG domain-containing metalloprotein [Malonomonas rubra]SHI78427.1 metal dependent phosphohydrolase [Malonomonas rubra DSM 5091]
MTKEEQEKARRGREAIFGDGVQGLRNRRKTNFGVWLLFALAFLLTLIIVPKGGLIPEYHDPGEIASRDIKSPRDLLVEDKPLTRAKQDEAWAAVPPVYDYQTTAGRQAVERIRSGLQLLLELRNVENPPAQNEFLPQLESDFGVPLTETEFSALIDLPLDPQIPHQASELLAQVFERPIVANLQVFEADRRKTILVRDVTTGEELPGGVLERTFGLNEALEQAKALLGEMAGLSPVQHQTLLKLVQQQLRPSLVFNEEETSRLRQQARDEVKPVLFQVKKGEMIVREGERVSADQILKLRAIRESGRDNRSLPTAFGLLSCTVLLIYIGYFYAHSNIRKFRPDSRDLLFLAMVMLALFMLIKISIFIATALGNTFAYIDSSAYFYAIPFALGAMLVRIVLNAETALLFSICTSILVGVLFGNSLPMALLALVSSLVGAHGVRHCQERSSIYRAGMWVGLANAALLIGIHFLAGRGFELLLAWKVCFGLFGGLLSTVFVTGTIPLVEAMFKYTTDIKLLELANMNSPVLRQLMVEAPGTYHHSILVGNLVEAAAESIHANPLLARVAAYYHDIGKIKKPLYFIENGGRQRNKHDKLAPSMSALILMSHLKDGVELAKEHKLGPELIDIIQQHHGTSLIKFFYDRAKTQTDADMPQPDERDYRYPGPKPQTREAALIMLADAIEAASRTLQDPTPARIQGMVQKLINNIFIDGQLDECELTLKDLHLIAKSFNRVLAGSFHHRVDYPEPVHIVREKAEVKEDPEKNGKAEKEEKPVVEEKVKEKHEDTDREPAGEAKDPEAAAAEDSPEDLKRLGIS